MFKPVSPEPNVHQIEDLLIRYWKTWRIAEQCEVQRRGSGEFVYYEKPVSPYRKPTLSQAIERAFGDIFLRYKAMRGYHGLRHSGWQAHGLPVELMIAKQLDMSSKEQIEEFGVENFIRRCRNSLDFYAPYWEKMNDHLAYWVNPQDAFVTFTNEYIESVWWAIKSLWDKGLLYQTLKVMPYCPACGVHLSESEANQDKHEAPEYTILSRFPLVNGPGTSLLVPTNVPWSLVGNVAVVVNPEAEYITIEQEAPGGGFEHLVVAQRSAKIIFGEVPLKIVDKFKGRKLKGEAYFPLYTFILPHKSAHFVIVDDRVREEMGTGIMPVAPVFCEQDLHLAQEHDLSLLNPLTSAGAFVSEVRPWSGKLFADASPFIIQDLDARGLLFSVKSHLAAQPHCPYCRSPLMDYAGNHWFIRFSQSRDELSDFSEEIIRNSNLEEDILSADKYTDRMLSYDRFWGAPLPIWECKACHHQHCIGSIAEFVELAGKDLTELDLHHTLIDEVYLKCPECEGQLVRIPELVLPWFETSCMPFAQWHYPFENQTNFEKQFPADLVCVSASQNDAWLIDCLAVNGILFGKAGFNQAVNLKSFSAERGAEEKAVPLDSIEPFEVMNELGGDVLRWHLCDCWQAKENRRTSSKFLCEDAIRKSQQTISLLRNAYSFFVAQANLSDWSPKDNPEKTDNKIIDRWLRSELHSLARDVTVAYETFDVFTVVTLLEQFITKLSSWYIQQSSLRFSKQKMNADKSAALAALYEALLTLSKLCAPVVPFLSEEIYQNLVFNSVAQGPDSVHLADWVIADLEAVDEVLEADMQVVMKLVSLGWVARNEAKIPAHQPLEEIAFIIYPHLDHRRIGSCIDLIKHALNVKQVMFLDSPALAEQYLRAREDIQMASQDAYQAVLVTRLTPALIDEGVAEQVILRVSMLRQQAGYGQNEPVRLFIKAAPRLLEVVFRNRQTIIHQCVVGEMVEGLPAPEAFTSQFEINRETILIGIAKH